MKRKRNEKIALCPLCNDIHKVFGDYWLIPASTRSSGVTPDMIHVGVQTEFWCDNEREHIVKQYSHEFKYIGYYRADEIPF